MSGVAQRGQLCYYTSTNDPIRRRPSLPADEESVGAGGGHDDFDGEDGGVVVAAAVSVWDGVRAAVFVHVAVVLAAVVDHDDLFWLWGAGVAGGQLFGDLRGDRRAGGVFCFELGGGVRADRLGDIFGGGGGDGDHGRSGGPQDP